MERNLIRNRWKTPDGTVLISRHTHDFVSHKDANGEEYFIDGGNDYIRKSVNKEEMENMCVYSDDQFSLIRTVLCRVTFDENNKRIWIPLCNMSNPHLENCITFYLFDENGCKNKYKHTCLPVSNSCRTSHSKEYTSSKAGHNKENEIACCTNLR